MLNKIGGFFLSVGATLAPGFGALGAFADPAGGLNAQFYNTFGITLPSSLFNF
jgi:hypothetical protein